MDKIILDKINKFTRREHSADEVFVFDMILCDNDVDRDFERFTLNSLEQLKALCIGKTGIFDHNAKGENQTARIFDARLETDTSKKTKLGEDYVYLKASAYMIRTSKNVDLIKDIEGGIKKEVSISCSVTDCTCSICGANSKVKPCSHLRGKFYGGKECYFALSNATDMYEWSFVAVPAQANAGITKHFCEGGSANSSNEDVKNQQLLSLVLKGLREDIVRLSFVAGRDKENSALLGLLDKMEISELMEFKKSMIFGFNPPKNTVSQLASNEAVSQFKTN